MAIHPSATECLEEAISIATDKGATPAEVRAEFEYLLENALEDGVFDG
jgi:hypothetical protein